MRYLNPSPAEELREKYNVIIGWGIKNEIRRLDGEKSFKPDYLVDGKNNNAGKIINGIVVEKVEDISRFRDNTSVLVVIYPNLESEIIIQVNELLPNADTISARLIKIKDKRSTYSSNCEDIIMYDYIKNICDNITYIDIGVCHPVVRNNTYLFYEQGFTDGVLIEPNKTMCDLARIYRPQNKLLNCGASSQLVDSELTYYYCDNSPGLNTFVKELAMKRNCENSFIKIPIFNINKLIEDNFNKRINVLDIDTEGMDFELLTALDTNRFQIDLICVEKSYIFPTASLMSEKGYKLYETTHENEIYIRK